MLNDVRKLPVNVLESFLSTRDAKACGIPEPVANYILELNFAANLYRKEPSIQTAAKLLHKEFPGISISTCRQRVFDAINYLNTDCTVTAESWNMYFADQMMEMRQAALALNDANGIKLAIKCMERARQYRIEASGKIIDPTRIQFKPQLVSADMELERMGVRGDNLLESWKKGLAIINKETMPDAEKERLKMELAAELGIEEGEEV